MTRASTRTPTPDSDQAPAELPHLSDDMAIDSLLHAAAVRAGVGAGLGLVLDGIPLLKPFVPARLKRAASSLGADQVQRELVRKVYARHDLKPARWEIDAVLAVAQSQGVMTPLATRAGLQSLLSVWLPSAVVKPLLRYTPTEALVGQTARAVASTWAAGRYADGVCKLRRAGADWLPAPVTRALKLTPAKLRDWSGEALSLMLPPLELAGRLFQLPLASEPARNSPSTAAPGRKPTASRSATRKPVAGKTVTGQAQRSKTGKTKPATVTSGKASSTRSTSSRTPAGTRR